MHGTWFVVVVRRSVRQAEQGRITRKCGEPGRIPVRCRRMRYLDLLIPAAVLLLVFLGAFEVLRKRRGRQPGTPLSAISANEITALFYGSKRVELDHRDSWSMMREEDQSGAPPFGVDLDNGTVTLRRIEPAEH